MKKSQIAAAVAASLAAGTASAAGEWSLVSITTKSSNGTAPLALGGGTLFDANGAGGVSAQASFYGGTNVSGTSLFTWGFGADFAINAAGSAASGTFNCYEGAFGGVVGASICGNYNFGSNGANQSTVNTDGSGKSLNSVPGTWGSADDGDIGPAQSIADFSGFTYTDSGGTRTYENGGATTGSIWVFSSNVAAVPVPAAAWLFGSALGLLGWARRRSAS